MLFIRVYSLGFMISEVVVRSGLWVEGDRGPAAKQFRFAALIPETAHVHKPYSCMALKCSKHVSLRMFTPPPFEIILMGAP